MIKIKLEITDTLDPVKPPTRLEFGIIKEVHGRDNMLEWGIQQMIPKLRLALAKSGLLEPKK